MAVIKPGDYITARCGKCDDITGHVVMIVVDGEILRVECKACGSVHKYRAQKTARLKKEATGYKHVRAGQDRAKATETGQKTTSPSRAGAAPKTRTKHKAAWEEAVFKLSHLEPQEYRMDTSFTVQTLVLHPTFGQGVVLTLHKPDKVDILFEEGVKTLRCKT